MAKKNNRPVFKNKAYRCFDCDSPDTVALAKEDNIIIWCECGMVTAIRDNNNNATEKEVFNFIEGIKKPYFTRE